MHIARHDSGVGGALRALASQIHPVFMLPPVAASAFGAVLAGLTAPGLALLHVATAFVALYTAHVKDGYVDFYGRGEDDDHPLTAAGCRFALAGSTALFFTGLLAVGVLVGPVAALLTLPGWLFGYLHAPHLDMNPVTATMGYPTGIGFALVGGYYVQAESLSASVVAFAVVFVTILSGIKIIDDSKDYEYDRSIDKRTVAVVLGRRRARTTAFAVMTLGLVAAVGFVLVRAFPPSAVAAPLVFGVVAAFAARGDDELATMLLIRGSYVFLALLVVAVWFRPLT
ncbi:1,4-dihydroxy-2-naphthoate octaprenyltransferase [Halogranum amylolyticum]|uniref:1,4-dihydroxy-2-naphthoate octaprenyltransferase n=1 Tax=Halogranum amylolyticum TaxID=660520 RepID=A0A1H8N4I0_9EURY|nr:1,4-dihydroxy-2-naphthoate octaprenyltransferase [Halogranum amylolyticum]